MVRGGALAAPVIHSAYHKILLFTCVVWHTRGGALGREGAGRDIKPSAKWFDGGRKQLSGQFLIRGGSRTTL